MITPGASRHQSRRAASDVTSSLHCRPDRTYIVTGGLGGFGLAVAEFLGYYGAKNIVITSKRGVRNGNQQAALQELYFQNINVSPSMSCCSLNAR